MTMVMIGSFSARRQPRVEPDVDADANEESTLVYSGRVDNNEQAVCVEQWSYNSQESVAV